MGALFFSIFFRRQFFDATGISRLIAAGVFLAACAVPSAFAQQPASAAEAPPPVALLIGNSSYPGTDSLKHPFKDARKLADELKKRGFEILNVGKDTIGQDLTREQMRTAIETLYSRIKPGS